MKGSVTEKDITGEGSVGEDMTGEGVWERHNW